MTKSLFKGVTIGAYLVSALFLLEEAAPYALEVKEHFREIVLGTYAVTSFPISLWISLLVFAIVNCIAFTQFIFWLTTAQKREDKER